jgi:hypothetical protein
MNNIIEYGIATAHNHLELAGYVNMQIVAGWQPYGNVFQTEQHNQTFMHQPMVMYEIKKKNLKQ